MKVKPGDIVKEYDMGGPKRHLASYLIIEAGEPLAPCASRWTSETFKCMCLVNNVQANDDKPGELMILHEDWINSEADASQRYLRIFWKVNNES